jgi:pimeloyl-ACP methyl ester carboxylesterase
MPSIASSLGITVALGLLAGFAHADERSSLKPCPGKPDLRCGKLRVLENRAELGGRQIELNVLLAPSRSAVRPRYALFYAAGGPGAASVNDAGGFVPALDALRATHDLVFVDQRGTGDSHRLGCTTNGSDERIQGFFERAMTNEQTVACRAELERKADLRQYTTSIAVDDLEEIRRRFGYEKVDVFGTSYGTRVAQIYQKRYPQSVRTLAMIGVVGPAQLSPLNHAQGSRRAFDLILTACLAEEACARSFPNIRHELDAVMRRLDQAPVKVEIRHPKSGEKVAVELSRGGFAESFRFFIYDAFRATAAPMLIHQAYLGDFTMLAEELLNNEPFIRKAIAFGQHLSVTCAEDVPFFPSEPHFLTDNTLLGDFRERAQREMCLLWPRAEIPADFHAPATGSTPALLISGQLDPVTPPFWAQEVAAHLPNSTHLLLEHGHHGTGGLSNGDCVFGVLNEFLLRGGAEGIDLSCLATMRRAPFATDPASFREMRRKAAGGG